MKDGLPTVFVVDPDDATRSAVQGLVTALNFQCQLFPTGREFFASFTDETPGCLVLEVKIPDMSGLQIQCRLARMDSTLPLVFLSSHDDVALAVQLLRGGAVHYLQKPLRPLELINAIQEAVAKDRSRRKVRHRRQWLLEQLATLTQKQREVLRLIAEGRSTKHMAAALQVSPRTIELRRNGLMKKLKLKSAASLLHFALLAHRQAPHHLDRARRGQAGSPAEFPATPPGQPDGQE